MNIFQCELRNVIFSFWYGKSTPRKKQLNTIIDDQVQLTLEASLSIHLLHPLIPTLSKLFFQSKDSIIPFGQIKIRFLYLAEGVLQSRNGLERVRDGFWSSWVCGRAVKTYQSQVIPTAIQCCDHHLLINNPYWGEETDKEYCVNALSFPLSGETWKNDILNFTLDVPT